LNICDIFSEYHTTKIFWINALILYFSDFPDEKNVLNTSLFKKKKTSLWKLD